MQPQLRGAHLYTTPAACAQNLRPPRTVSPPKFAAHTQRLLARQLYLTGTLPQRAKLIRLQFEEDHLAFRRDCSTRRSRVLIPFSSASRLTIIVSRRPIVW